MPHPDVDAMAEQLSNWGRWGPDDELGTVNFITGAKRVEAARLVRTGKTFSLAIPLDASGPQGPGERRLNPQHIMLDTGTDLIAGRQRGRVEGWGSSDDMVIMALQCATQWDSLAHTFYGHKMYNDRDCILVDDTGAEKNSISVLADKVVTRGVLADVPRYLGVEWLPADHHISPEELQQTLDSERVELKSGDALLIRTGNLGRIRATGSWAGFSYATEPGIGMDSLPFLSEREVAAVAADNWAFEVLPSGTSLDMPVHAVGAVYMGLLVGEIFDLDVLATDCAADGVYEFYFASPPLPFSRAVGSPINPLAVK